MNLEENDFQKNERKKKKLKKNLVVVSVLIMILMVAAASVWIMAKKLAREQLKVNIDGIYSASASQENGLFLLNEDKAYIAINQIASRIGYTYYNGEYKQYTEDTTKGYVTNSKETVTFASGAREIRKYPLLDNNAESQRFEIDEEIKMRGNTLYISEDGLEKAFNLVFEYNKNNNTINIATLPYLSAQYSIIIENAALEEREFKDSVKFNNQKAILSNYIVIKDPNTYLYGMASISDASNPIITPRYKQVEFIEGVNDFIVKTQENKYGIIGKDGITKVKPAYDAIQQLDKDAGLYLVTSNRKQGVINESGKIIIYQDYDQIGLKQGYQDPNVTNRYLLLNNCIPVMRDGKWGLIDIYGETLVDLKYDGIGCSVSERNKIGNVVIPDIDAIVVELDQGYGTSKVQKYGLINSHGSPMVNTVCDKIYFSSLQNVITYYIDVQDQSINIVDYWYEQKERYDNVEDTENAEQNKSENKVENKVENKDENRNEDNQEQSNQQNQQQENQQEQQNQEQENNQQ